MSPILTLEAEIRAALKTAGAPRTFDLLADIQAGVKIAGEAVTPPSTPAAPTGGGGAPTAPAPAAPTTAAGPGLGTPAPGAPPAPGAGGPPAVSGKPAAGGAPTATHEPYAVPKRPQAAPGMMQQGWDAVKNNWDYAAIPLSMLAMMFGGKAGKMLGVLGMAAGGYGLYNRYQGMQNYGTTTERAKGMSDAEYENARAGNIAGQMNTGFMTAQDVRAAKPLLDQATAVDKQITDMTAKLAPDLQAKVQPLLEARTALLDAQTAYNKARQLSQDPEVLGEADAAVKAAQTQFDQLGGADPALKPILDARQQSDSLKHRYEGKIAARTKWEKDNRQVIDSLKMVKNMAPGAMLSQIQSSHPRLKGATDRTLQDFMYAQGIEDTPADYSRSPMTPEEQQANAVLKWMMTDPEAKTQLTQGGGPGMGSTVNMVWDRLAGNNKRAWE